MSGQSGGGRERHCGRTESLTICLDIKNGRKTKMQEEQEKKEQAKTRCLDQFFLTKTNPGSNNVNAILLPHIILKIILK